MALIHAATHPTVNWLRRARRTVWLDLRGRHFSRAAQGLPWIVAGVLTVGVLASVAAGHKPSHLFKEGRLFTLLSGGLLLSIGLVNLHIFRLRGRTLAGRPARERWSRAVWLIMGLGFVYLFLDEVSCFHEKIGDWAQTVGPGPGALLHERLDSLVVAAYLVPALAVLASFRHELRRHWTDPRSLVVGFVLFGIMVVCDFLTEDTLVLERVLAGGLVEPAFMLIEMLEDFFKLMAIVFFLRAFLVIRHRLLRGAAAGPNGALAGGAGGA